MRWEAQFLCSWLFAAYDLSSPGGPVARDRKSLSTCWSSPGDLPPPGWLTTFHDRPQLVPPQQRRKGWRVLPPESTYCTNLEGSLPIRRLSHDWLRPPSSLLGAPSTLKNDGGLSLASPSISHLLSFLLMVQYSITTTTSIRSPLEQDYEYDKDNDVFLFYPSRPAFESSRDHLFLPVRVSPGGPQDESNHFISIVRLSTTSRCLETIG